VELDSARIADFEQQAIAQYRQLENFYSVLLSKHTLDEDKFYAKMLASKCFESGAIIYDIFEDGKVALRQDEYFNALLAERGKKKIFAKDRRLITDSLQLTPSTADKNPDRKGLYRNYSGNIIYEEMHASSFIVDQDLIGDRSLNSSEVRIFKRLKTKITSPDGTRSAYKLFFEGIDILDRQSAEWPGLKKEARKSSEEFTAEREIPVIPVDPKVMDSLYKTDTFLIHELQRTSPEDSLELSGLNFTDFMLPGIGHQKFGRNRHARNTRTVVYGALFVSGLTYTVVNKIQSDRYYRDHRTTTLIRELDRSYEKANSHHKRFIVGAAFTAAVWIVNAAHLLELQYKNTRGADSPVTTVTLNTENGPGLSLVYTF
jgi:hypothetical protein